MRRLIVFLALITFVCGCGNITKRDKGNSETQQTGTAEISFREYEHDFGKVAEGEKIAYVFTFENKGTSDLVIYSATTTCGCTVPKYSVKPIGPGGSGNMEVEFDTSGRNSMQTKTITVKSNASKPIVLLKITADVVPNNNK
jgi:hypothetical protein